MTVSIWTYEDIMGRPEPEPVDRDPNIDCPECGAVHSYREYWEERYVEDKDWDPAEVYWLCDDCIAEAYAEYDLHKRKQEHRQLSEWKR